MNVNQKPKAEIEGMAVMPGASTDSDSSFPIRYFFDDDEGGERILYIRERV